MNRFIEHEINVSLDNIGAAKGTIRTLKLMAMHNPPIFLMPELKEGIARQRRIIKREQARIDALKAQGGYK